MAEEWQEIRSAPSGSGNYVEGGVMDINQLDSAEFELLEEFREELAPQHVSGMFYTTTLPAELVTLLYTLIDEKLAAADGLPAAVRKSLKEVS
jgi:ABC-type transporter Mla MlaB component